MAKMSRRTFLATAGASAVATAGAGWFTWQHTRNTAVIAAILHDALPYLQLDTAGVDAFARDFVARMEATGGQGLPTLGMAPITFFDQRYFLLDESSTQFAKLKERLVRQYLLSTDFFDQGADKTQPVHYVRLFDPYLHTCANPFAQWGLDAP